MAVYMDHLLSRIRLSIWLLSSELEGLLRAFCMKGRSKIGSLDVSNA